MEGHSFQVLGGDCNKGGGASSYHHLFLVNLHLLRVSFFKFQALECAHACPALDSLRRNGAEGHVREGLVPFSTFALSSWGCPAAGCCFMWAFLPFSPPRAPSPWRNLRAPGGIELVLPLISIPPHSSSLDLPVQLSSE